MLIVFFYWKLHLKSTHLKIMKPKPSLWTQSTHSKWSSNSRHWFWSYNPRFHSEKSLIKILFSHATSRSLFKPAAFTSHQQLFSHLKFHLIFYSRPSRVWHATLWRVVLGSHCEFWVLSHREKKEKHHSMHKSPLEPETETMPLQRLASAMRCNTYTQYSVCARVWASTVLCFHSSNRLPPAHLW